MLLSEAIVEFTEWKKINVTRSTMVGYNLMLRQMAVFLRDIDIEDVKVRDIVDYFGLMQKLGWDQNSFIPRAMAIRKFFEYFTQSGVKVMNPWLVPVPQKDYKISRVAGDEDYRKLIASIPNPTNDPRHIRNLAFINLLWDTGARNGEICSLNVSDLDLGEMKAVIKTEKSKGVRPVREIFWTDKTNESIERWLKKREYLSEKMYFVDKNALFVSVCNAQAGNRMNIRGIGEMLRQYCNRAKIPHMNAHSFRHRMGHHIIKQGGSNSDVSNILGHSSLQSSFVYTQMTNLELQERYKNFMENKPKNLHNVDRKRRNARVQS
jgi:site-specific recombinase XerD